MASSTRRKGLLLMFAGSLILLVIYSIFTLQENSVHIHIKDPAPIFLENGVKGHVDPNKGAGMSDESHTELFIKIAELLQKASLHTKSMKAAKAIREANDNMEELFRAVGMDYLKIKARQETKPNSVCPEIYKGSEFGFPLYEKGWEVSTCDYGVPLPKLITVLHVTTNVSRNVGVFVSSLVTHLKDVNTFIATSYDLKLDAKYNHVSIFQFNKTLQGQMWNSILKKVKTKYVLIARDVEDIDIHIRLERLIREIERLGVSAAAGSSRHVGTRRWTIGCYQRAFRNYTLVYHEGYDESVHECMVCDHVDGPFVMETSKAVKTSFNSKIDKEGLFEDFFIRLGQEQAVVCPESMFHVRTKERSKVQTNWRSFANQWEIYKMKFVPGFDIPFPCQLTNKCHKGERNVISPCCMAELGDMTTRIMNVCDKYGVICELNGGTLLAAVKMGKLFPWDVDSDVMVLLSNYTTLAKHMKEMTTSKYRISTVMRNKYKNKVLVGAAHNLISRNWFAEMYGKIHLSSEKFTAIGRGQTKVYLHGRWVGAAANPGLWVRNRYGEDIFKHAEHWRHLGRKTQFQHKASDTRRFRVCKTPGDQKCLDNYKTDGNLQFWDPIP